MGDKSGIEWTDATWNPVTGCTKVSQGCKYCYAERLFPRAYGRQLVADKHDTVALKNISVPAAVTIYRRRLFRDIHCHPERLDQPLHWRRPRRIFVNSMSDLFHEDVPDDFITRVFAVMVIAQQHTFQILTKRPERMRRYFYDSRTSRENIVKGAAWSLLGYHKKKGNAGMNAPWPLPNVWLGVSAEDQKTFDERVAELAATPAAIRFVSCEPLLSHIDCGSALESPTLSGPLIHWVIVGGESGPHARPSHSEWFRSLRDQCQAAGVPFFFKQWGEYTYSPINFDCHYDHASLAPTSDGVLAYSGGPGERWLLREKPGTWEKITELRADLYEQHRVGKKAAGRLLDGRTWDEFPR